MIAPHSRTSPPVQAPEKYNRGLGWRGTLVGLAACLLAVCTSALATRVVPMATPELFRNSAAIFIGEVRNSDPTCPGGKKPCTKVTFSGVEVLAGNLPQGDVTFDLPEGELDDGSFLRIEGAPRFVPGVRYLVFARSGEWYNTPVTNWFHSVFRELRAGPQASAVFFVDHQG